MLLGAQLLGLENVIVAKGDPFSPRDLERVKSCGRLHPDRSHHVHRVYERRR